jgi:hypothetical protein
MLWLFVLPWVLLALGLGPLWASPLEAEVHLYPGLLYLVAGLLTAGMASLYTRAPVGPRVRGWWVVGLGLVAHAAGSQAANLLGAGQGATWLWVGGFSSLAAAACIGVAFAVSLGAEAQPLPRLEGSPYCDPDGIMNSTALWATAPSLEALARRRPVHLLLLHTAAPVDQLLPQTTSTTLIFRLEAGTCLLVLQNNRPSDAQALLRRLKETTELPAYTAATFRGGRLKPRLEELRAELTQQLLAYQPTER